MYCFRTHFYNQNGKEFPNAAGICTTEVLPYYFIILR